MVLGTFYLVPYKKGKVSKMITLKQEKLSLSQAIDAYLAYYKTKGVVQKSYDGKKAMLDKLLLFIGNEYLEDLKEPLLNFYTITLNRDDISTNSKGTYLRSVKAFVNWLNKEYQLSLPLPFIVSEQTIKGTYTNEELQILIKKPNKWKNFSEYRNWVIIQLLIDTGMRSATLRNIKHSDIYYKEGYIITRHSKTKKQQIIPISKTMAAEIKKYEFYTQQYEYLFTDIYGNQLSENALKLAIRKYNTSRGVSKTSIHLFRHTFAKRYLMEMNGDPFRLQKLLGHSTMNTTRNYVAIYDKDLLDQYELTSPLELLSKKKIKL